MFNLPSTRYIDVGTPVNCPLGSTSHVAAGFTPEKGINPNTNNLVLGLPKNYNSTDR